MAKAKENVQALVLRATNQNGLARRQGVNHWGGKLTRAEELVLAEMQKRGILIDGEGQISVQIIDQVCQIMQHMGIGFAETAQHHGQLNLEAQGTEYQPLVQQFNDESLQQLAQYLFTIGGYAAGAMAEEIRRPYPMRDATESWLRGLLRRMNGG